MAVTTADRHRFAHLRVTVLLVVLLATLLPAAPAQADQRSAPRIQTKIENKINRARVSHGLAPLRVNRRLEHWASDHARYMGRNRTLVHDSLTRLRLEAPRRALVVAENIGYNTRPNAAKRAHRLFMRSPAHRANLLHPGMTHMGIGVVKRGRYTYIVQRFARLR